ncbi:hypothetical protein QBC35DRAFT_556009 [Podospora australis]|uniref:Heterokaryon incompatibility domain-containing protein n=1 Tax=Podospora australis TaxID=1536484 RepID=A0AAN6WPD4_9PEZI|nr:hypothetical protein QBC35DRAFT_556009 [Podospora australis]
MLLYSHPLKEDQFRLLEVTPTGDPASPVTCSMVTVPRNQCPYDALSYTWGDVSDIVPIMVNHESLMCTKQCTPANTPSRSWRSERQDLRVDGPMGSVSDTHAHNGIGSETFIDYSRSVREVYTSFACHVIGAQGNLSTLLTAGLWQADYGPDLEIPSWVPDLRSVSGVDPRFIASYHLGHFDASSGHIHDIQDIQLPVISEDDECKLLVRGFIVGTVKKQVSNTKSAALAEVASLYRSSTPPSGLSQLEIFFLTTTLHHKGFLSAGTEEERCANWKWSKRLLFCFCRQLNNFNNAEAGGVTAFDIPAFLDKIEHRLAAHAPKTIGGEDPEPWSTEYASLCTTESGKLEEFWTEYLYRTGEIFGGRKEYGGCCTMFISNLEVAGDKKVPQNFLNRR